MDYSIKPKEHNEPLEHREVKQDSTIENVMIDPSLLVSKNMNEPTFNRIEDLNSLFDFYYPKSFGNLLDSRNEEALKFYRGRAKSLSISEIESTLRSKSEFIEPYTVSNLAEEQYNQLKTDMSFVFQNSQYPNKLTDVLFQQSVFLFEESWMVSRIKKSFNYIKRSGAVAVEIGEVAVRRTIDKEDTTYPLSLLDYLNAFGKWVGVSGSPLAAYSYPEFSVPISAANGLYLLFDP